jgi:beta-phosphoglucomutase
VIKGVIFDLDGVLVTTDENHFLGWKHIADAEGIYFDRTINHRQRGVSRMESLEVLLERATRSYTAAEKEELAARKNDFYRRSLANLTPADLLPGAGEILAQLRQRGIKTAIGSSSKNTPLIMERVGLVGRLDAVADGNDITRSKPDPQVFLLAAERLGLEPAACLVVEDAPAGIEAGRRAGMDVFGIGTPHTLPGVERIAPSLVGVSVDDLLEAGQG